jgi:hypothetical protein
MKLATMALLLTAASSAQVSSTQLPLDDAIRVAEFYRLTAQCQDQLWEGWSQTPAPLLLLTKDKEFLTHHPAPPKEFEKVSDTWYRRPRHFPPSLQATFPAFGPPSVIVIGEPENTESKTSTPGLFTVMHEHFHQLQNWQANYFSSLEKLGLSRGDRTGMWMLDYPFPYERPEVAQAFRELRDLLLACLEEADAVRFRDQAGQYLDRRKRFFARLSSDDRKYLAFQLWQEGIARYTQVKAAEAAARYQPSSQYQALADFESFAHYAQRARTDTLRELREIDLIRSKRTAVYCFGAGEGFLLDRLNSRWKQSYFERLLSTDELFENLMPQDSRKPEPARP